jgi:hypothetical protein
MKTRGWLSWQLLPTANCQLNRKISKSLIRNEIKLATVCQLNPVGKILPTFTPFVANLLLRDDVCAIGQMMANTGVFQI